MPIQPGDKMKAVRYHARKDIRVDEVEVRAPQADEALIEVEWCGLCGSDLHEYLIGPVSSPRGGPHKVTGEAPPVILGHEICGRVLTAPADSPFRKGQVVAVDPRLSCNSCTWCDDKTRNVCSSVGFLGYSGIGGGFSKALPVKLNRLHVLPESMVGYGALVEPLAVAWRAVKQAGEVDFTDVPVLIVGGGPVGIAVIKCLRVFKANKIFVSEPTKRRREMLSGMVEEVFDPTQENIGERCRALTAGGRGVDVSFDCAGVPSGLADCIDAVRFRGTHINIAAWEQPMVMNWNRWLIKETCLKTSLAYDDDDIKQVVTALREGQFEGLEDMITSRISVEDVVEKGIKELIENKDKHVKILVSPKL